MGSYYMGSSGMESLKVVMLPWLGYGHISPFLELAKKLSDKNFDIYICSTPEYLSSIKKRITENYFHSIHPVELHLDSLPRLPPHDHIINSLNFNLLTTLQPDLLIHDIVLISAASVASQHNIPAVAFHTCSATVASYYGHLYEHPGVEFPFPDICLKEYELSISFVSKDPEREDDHVQTDGIFLINSSREMEGKYMDYFSQLTNWEVMPIGALVWNPTIERDNDDDDSDTELMEWLGRKKELSTVLVSFGSECNLKREEIEEIAYGLELSNLNFIWVMRAPQEDELRVEEHSLPQGFLERVQERGRILERWAPQAKILNHSSIGGFVSHCGWNSLLESIEFGVPIIAMPVHVDQPINAKVLVELGVALEVLRDEKGRLQREEISRVIKGVAVGKGGEIMRRKVDQLRKSIRSTRREEIEGVVQKLTQLCGKGK